MMPYTVIKIIIIKLSPARTVLDDDDCYINYSLV